MIRVSRVSKRGFTLLETMLSVALLLIVSLIVYEGFMTSLNYSGDTALAERVSNDNAGTVYTTLSQKTSGSSEAGYHVPIGIRVDGAKLDVALQVNRISSSGGMSVFSDGSAYTDDAPFLNTVSRSGFSYVARACKTHTSKACSYYKITGSDGKKYIEIRCNESGCTYASTFCEVLYDQPAPSASASST